MEPARHQMGQWRRRTRKRRLDDTTEVHSKHLRCHDVELTQLSTVDSRHYWLVNQGAQCVPLLTSLSDDTADLSGSGGVEDFAMARSIYNGWVVIAASASDIITQYQVGDDSAEITFDGVNYNFDTAFASDVMMLAVGLMGSSGNTDHFGEYHLRHYDSTVTTLRKEITEENHELAATSSYDTHSPLELFDMQANDTLVVYYSNNGVQLTYVQPGQSDIGIYPFVVIPVE